VKRSDQGICSSASISDMNRVSLSALKCSRLLDQMLTAKKAGRWANLAAFGGCGLEGQAARSRGSDPRVRRQARERGRDAVDLRKPAY
jgi:hypothetical protein